MNLLELLGFGKRADRVGMSRQFRFEKVLARQTPAGFFVQYKLRGLITIDNSGKPLANRIRVCDEALREKLINTYTSLHISFVDRFFAWGWTLMARTAQWEPWTWLYELGARDGGLTLTVDVNQARLVKESGKIDIGHYDGRWIGCSVEVVTMESGLWDDTLRKANFKMLTKEQLEQIESTEPYRTRIEQEAIAAMMKLSEIRKLVTEAETFQKHGGDGLTISHRRVDSTLEIKWEFWKGMLNGRYHVCGHRTEGGFGPSSDGTQMLNWFSDRIACGTSFDSLEPGKTYYYTFTLKREAGLVTKDREFAPICFSIHVPSLQEQNERETRTLNLKLLLERAGKSRPGDPAATYATELDRVLARLQVDIKAVATSTKAQSDVVQEINANKGGLSDDEVTRLVKYAEQQFMNYREDISFGRFNK